MLAGKIRRTATADRDGFFQVFVSFVDSSFSEGDGSCSGLVLEAMLAYWLSCFIFLSGPQDGHNNYVFPLVNLFAKGKKVALAPNYLGSLCTCMDECIANVMRSLVRYDVASCIDSLFLQMFVWERSGLSFVHL